MTNHSAPDQPPDDPAFMDAGSSDEPPAVAISELAAKAIDELSETVRRNPLAAVGVAFTAGLFIALLAKG